jgi:hypothetical protein
LPTGLLRVAQDSPQDLGPPQETGENQGGCAVTALFPPGGQSNGSGSEDHDALPTCDVEFDVARRFLRLADIDNGAFRRLLGSVRRRSAFSATVFMPASRGRNFSFRVEPVVLGWQTARGPHLQKF